MTDTTCPIAECTRVVRAGGLCAAHYQRKRKYGDPEFKHDLECAKCGAPFKTWSGKSKYCSNKCLSANRKTKSLKNGPTCADCGVQMHRGKGVLPQGQARCLKCKNAGRGYYEVNGRKVSHGQSGYGAGCRCDVCRKTVTEVMRDYVEQRIERDGVHPTTALRRAAAGRDPLKPAYDRKKVPCKECGEPMMSVKPQGQAVHNKCKPGSRWYAPEALRLEVYERDGWKCQICFHPVDRDAPALSDWYPTLDHIIPQSVRVDHSAENLRLACRYCNLARRDRPAEKDYIVRKWANERRCLEVV